MTKFLSAVSASAMIFAMASHVAAQDIDLNQVVAKGDGFEIFLGDVLALKSDLPPEYLQQDPAQLYPELVNQLVSQAIVAKEADTQTDIYKYKTRQSERAVAVNQVLEAHIAAGLTDEYLQKTYDEVIGSQALEQEWNASHILVETADDAIALIEELNAGADFAELAKEKSTGPSGPQGGELGWFGAGQMVPEFEEAVQDLEAGAISAAPVQTQFGFHVIKLNEAREKPKPTREEVDQQLREYGTQILMEEKVAQARDGVDVEITEGIDPSVLNTEF